MLTITVPAKELFDAVNSRFIYVKEQTIQLEHSLVSISKWESKWEIPFLGKGEKTREQMLDYIRCMTITKNVDPTTYLALTSENVEQISKYINAKMTATWFNEKEKRGRKSSEVVTSELIYYWMIVANIPPEYQKWHLNRLLTLIKICGIKSNPGKKRSKREILEENRRINAQRRAEMNTRG